MELRGTEETTEIVLERMENSLGSLEQMSFDAINITDKLVNGIDEIMQCTDELADCQDADRERILKRIRELLEALLNTAFSVNNVSHELEKETVYQRDTLENIRQIVEFLYAMSDV
ncbi:hypothetical protein D7V86_06245 [bacterium D16-51]|nr:hypothetical protein D7V96_03085 [bacterium D16-59]RKI61122.1 hypothetical protein D7V86_06245 [bacterium D16-51]